VAYVVKGLAADPPSRDSYKVSTKKIYKLAKWEILSHIDL